MTALNCHAGLQEFSKKTTVLFRTPQLHFTILKIAWCAQWTRPGQLSGAFLTVYPCDHHVWDMLYIKKKKIDAFVCIWVQIPFDGSFIQNPVPIMMIEWGVFSEFCLLMVTSLPGSGGRFKNMYELLNLRALKFSQVNNFHIFQCMGKIFCVEFQRYPLKFHTKYLTHTLKDMVFIRHWNFKSS